MPLNFALSGPPPSVSLSHSTISGVTPMNDLILQPILFMGMLSLVMMLLMYITRIPAAKVLEAEVSICRSSLTRRSWEGVSQQG